MQNKKKLTVMGEQVTPTRASTSWASIPKPARIVAIPGSVGLPTVSQHSVLAAGAELGMGVATARSAKEAKIASLENIFA